MTINCWLCPLGSYFHHILHSHNQQSSIPTSVCTQEDLWKQAFPVLGIEDSGAILIRFLSTIVISQILKCKSQVSKSL
ncbi:hypothetical protein L1987_57416 [Smallanthus sonchifolius]|uniref:Uncharacterized protein n=1 Tax=Smallanthus sonchifolius TaxID=185202 RepID=A0ACB9DCM9_9ASTR|nr:hypothetical protein L1987_57416 [Smallanthus sonchifolius]